MASLQELRKRLRSIQSTGKLAGAMRTAATAKYARLGRLRGDFGAYAGACREMRSLLGSAGIVREAETIEPRDCLVVLSGNRGLCGGFHAELFRFLDEQLAARQTPPLLLVGGRKAAQYLRERGAAFEEFSVSEVPAYQEIKPLAERARSLYARGETERVLVVYQSFRNMLTQVPAARQLLPEAAAGEPETEAPPLYLPDAGTIRAQLAASCLDAEVFDLALENAAGAQAATMMAMRSACDNAAASAADLEVTINRRRQAEVTSSVIETASGIHQQGD